MMRRFATIFVILALLLGGGVTSCLAAIANARALECCSKDCPQPPAHTADQCCAVSAAAQDGEVAPALQVISPDALMFSTAIPAAAGIFAPSLASSRAAIHFSEWSPPPRHIQLTLCLLQL
jgi:hypothetical protein